MKRDGPGLGIVPFPNRALLHHLDACQPRSEQTGPTGEGKVFSGWYVPHWLMLRVKGALREAEA